VIDLQLGVIDLRPYGGRRGQVTNAAFPGKSGRERPLSSVARRRKMLVLSMARPIGRCFQAAERRRLPDETAGWHAASGRQGSGDVPEIGLTENVTSVHLRSQIAVAV